LPRLRPKRSEPARAAPGDLVYALTDVSKGARFVRKGEPLRRDDPMVRELPSEFEVRYPLILEEVNDDGK
jgi:hypothetical protein